MTETGQCYLCARFATRGYLFRMSDGRWRCKSSNACQRRIRLAKRTPAQKGFAPGTVVATMDGWRIVNPDASGYLEQW